MKSNDEELMIVSELYMNGNIRSSDFNDSFFERYDLMYEAVLDSAGRFTTKWCLMNRKGRRIYKEKIESLIQAWNNKEQPEPVNYWPKDTCLNLRLKAKSIYSWQRLKIT